MPAAGSIPYYDWGSPLTRLGIGLITGHLQHKYSMEEAKEANKYNIEKNKLDAKQAERETILKGRTEGKLVPAKSGAARTTIMGPDKGLWEPRSPDFTLSQGQERLTAEGQPIASVAPAGAHKVGAIKEFKVGDKVITKEWTGSGWDKVTEGPRYKPGVTVNVGGKKIPASQIEKIGEYGAYRATLVQIKAMVDKGTIDTGPFEFLRKRVDNWGVAPKKERIQLRGLVARLPGLLYAMRGKQLSDKEFEVAMNMMPKMETDEVVFGEDLKLFTDYLNKVLVGKKEAYKGGGYDVGSFGEPAPQQGHNLDKYMTGE